VCFCCVFIFTCNRARTNRARNTSRGRCARRCAPRRTCAHHSESTVRLLQQADAKGSADYQRRRIRSIRAAHYPRARRYRRAVSKSTVSFRAHTRQPAQAAHRVRRDTTHGRLCSRFRYHPHYGTNAARAHGATQYVLVRNSFLLLWQRVVGLGLIEPDNNHMNSIFHKISGHS